MIRILSTSKVVFLILFNWLYAQNLVSNASFEDMLYCPVNTNAATSTDEMRKSNGWRSYTESPDYFHVCNSNWPINPGYVTTTSGNFFGQQAPVTGVAYAGFTTRLFSHGEFVEYIGRELDSPLEIGEMYYVSFYVSLSDRSRYGCGNIGMLFLNQEYHYENKPLAYRNYAQVNHVENIIDKENWVKVSGCFIADSAYTHFAIGNFFKELAVENCVELDCSPCHDGPYYYVDDICISPNANECGLSPFSLAIDADSVICQGEALEVEAPYTDATYEWSTGNNSTFIRPNSSGTYWVEASNQEGCTLSDTFTVQVLSPPTIDLGNDTIICDGSPLELNLNTSLDDDIFWSTGGITDSLIIEESGTYWAEVNNQCGFTMDSIQVSIYPQSSDIGDFIFSPYDSPFPSQFELPFETSDNYSIRIYDLLGHIVFRSTDRNQTWTGLQDAAGMYLYIVSYEDCFGKMREASGKVVLMK